MNGKALSGVSVSEAVCRSKNTMFLVGWTSALLHLITFAAYGVCAPGIVLGGMDVLAVKAAVKRDTNAIAGVLCGRNIASLLRNPSA